MKKVNVMNHVHEILETVEVRNPRICLCGKEMFILQDGHDRMWACACMKELIFKCVCCNEWVYEDRSFPEDFDNELGVTFYHGHPHCMMKKAKELRLKKGKMSK